MGIDTDPVDGLTAGAVVSIPGATGIPWSEPASLRPLEPLVREQPIDGVSTDLSTPIRWMSSDDADDFIKLTVSQGDGGGWIDSSVWLNDDRQQGPVAATLSRLVRCELKDTGSFVLPHVVQAASPAAKVSVITLVRRRESVRELSGARLSILQSSYPLPVKRRPSGRGLAERPSPPVEISKGMQSSLAVTVLPLTSFGPSWMAMAVPSLHTKVLPVTTFAFGGVGELACLCVERGTPALGMPASLA